MKTLKLRSATANDLQAINRVIHDAVFNWPIASRVKRLAVGSLQYDETDMKFFQFSVAVFGDEIVGVAAWEAHGNHELPNGKGGIFHGLYVLPIAQRQGIGRRLMDAVFADAISQQSTGLLFRAQRVSSAYFEQQSLERLSANEDEYAWQYWKRLA